MTHYLGWTKEQTITEAKEGPSSRLKGMAEWYGLNYRRYMGKRAGLPRGTLDSDGLRREILRLLGVRPCLH